MLPKIRDNTEENKLPVFSQLALLLVVLLLIFSGGLVPAFFSSKSDTTTNTSPPSRTETIIEVSSEPQPTPFSETAITGQSAFVWDIAKQKALFKKNEDDSLPLASITKLMTALVAHEILAEQDAVTISEMALKQDGPSGLMLGETFDRLSLSDLTLVSSSNDGAYALAYAAGGVLSESDPANAFVQAMNIRAREIGLTSTTYKNPTGLDISLTEGGAYGTARDTAFLMEYIIEHAPDILSRTTESAANVLNNDGIPHDAENTNYFVDQIPGLIGSKTGYTDLAGGNLTIAFEGGLNRPVVVVVLGSTRQDRFTDVQKLVTETKLYLAQN